MKCTVYVLSKTLIIYTVADSFYITIGEDRLIKNYTQDESFIKKSKLYTSKFTIEMEEISVNAVRESLPELWL